VGIFSFYPTKNMTTGEGGIITTNNDEVARKARLLRDHGQTSKYVHEILGWNLRMTNITAALGRVQLRRLDYLNSKREKNAERLTMGLKNVKGITTPYVDPRVKHVWNQYVIRIEDNFPLTRDELIKYLRDKGVETAVHYPMPVHHQPIYRKLGYREDACPNAIEASRRVLSLPVHPLLTDEDIDYIVKVIRRVETQ
jgi:perosamine synthetase